MKEKTKDIEITADESETVLRVQNLSKTYRLGEIGTGTISHDLNRWWAKIRGKEDPYATVGTSNDRTQQATKGEYVKVLDDINFEVKKGEVLGIIGKNGAGKSTLLKVISQITSPTAGSIKAKGRIATLLEVGTGMHPEMTGKENVYLNGTILGMTKKEIDSKYDEIMEFAGCAKYANTPVKRYSSGMKVRLGFAVAAFLEPEILIVDEVLAVGDAEFQKKAIGKMKDISTGQGRTIIFVSHDLQAITSLTSKVLLLDKGTIKFIGDTIMGVREYISYVSSSEGVYLNNSKSTPVISKVCIRSSDSGNVHVFGEPLTIDFEIYAPKGIPSAVFSFQILNSSNVKVLHVLLKDSEVPICRGSGTQRFSCYFKKLRLYPDKYSLILHLSDHISRVKYETIEGVCPFEIQVRGELREYYWKPSEAIYIEDAEWIV